MTEQIGEYTVVEALRQGGMARTVLARAPDQSLVVIKIPLQDDAGLFARLRDEHRVGSRVRHPHLVRTLGLIDCQGRPALVLNHIKGVPLNDLRFAGPIPEAGVATIGAQIASALAALHGAVDDDGRPLGIVHRDVSSGNILVSASGSACLIDLGIARWDELRSAHTETGALIGTVRYFAPEILEAGNASPASDVWALACCLAELFLDRAVFSGRTQEVLVAISRFTTPDEILGASLKTPLGRILATGLVRDPNARPTPAEFGAALQAYAAQSGGDAGLADLRDLVARAITHARAKRTTTSTPLSQATTQAGRTLAPTPSARRPTPQLLGAVGAVAAVAVAVGIGFAATRSPTSTTATTTTRTTLTTTPPPAPVAEMAPDFLSTASPPPQDATSVARAVGRHGRGRRRLRHRTGRGEAVCGERRHPRGPPPGRPRLVDALRITRARSRAAGQQRQKAH